MGQLFDQAAYVQIKSQLRFDRSYLITLSIVGLDWLLIAAGIFLLRTGRPIPYVLSQFLFAIIFFHNFCILHECGHGNASSKNILNTVTGLYSSILCFTPFFPWKYIHNEHHTWAGNPDRDPTGRNLKNWRRNKRVPLLLRIAWRTWIPLGALAQHFVFWSYPMVLLREDRSKIWQCLVSVALLPSAYLALYLRWPEVFRPQNFILAFVIYLFCEELVNLPHHLDLFKFDRRLPLWEQWKAARSCYYPPFVSELLVLNFNFHIEHHLYPSLPWFRLRAARRYVSRALGSDYNEAVGLGWNLSNRSRDVQDLVLAD
jgi:fatty acid desaturase